MLAPGTSTPRNKNAWLVRFRRWHTWGGGFLSLLILAIAITGILLNHKSILSGQSGGKAGPTGLLTTTQDLGRLPIGFDQALALAHAHFGDVVLEKIELKDEHGTLIYKVSRGGGDEIRIDAESGALASKYGVALAGSGETRMNWEKLVKDIHTGKIFGFAGVLTADATSVVIIALTLTGLYLWIVPILRKRRSARDRLVLAERPSGLPQHGARRVGQAEYELVPRAPSSSGTVEG